MSLCSYNIYFSVQIPGGYSTFFQVGISGMRHRNGVKGTDFSWKSGLRNWKFSTFWGLMNWNLGLILTNLSCRNQNLLFLLKLGFKELNHTATGDLKNGGRCVKRGSWPPDIPVPPFQVSALPETDTNTDHSFKLITSFDYQSSFHPWIVIKVSNYSKHALML